MKLKMKLLTLHLFCFRMNDAQSVALITADESLRGGKKLRLKDTADAAVKGLIRIILKFDVLVACTEVMLLIV